MEAVAEEKVDKRRKVTFEPVDDAPYSMVEFHPRTHPTQTDRVVLCVNGEVVTAKRATPVCIHKKFLECARHGKYQIFEQEPGKDRKTIGEVMTFPYTVIEKDLTEKDYLEWFKKSNKADKKQPIPDED